MSIEGRLVDASNTTLYCALTGDGVTAACVYKPVRGERPLWDFPDGTLAGREVAAYVVSPGAGLERRPADRVARRPARRGHGPALDGRRRDRRPDPAGARRPAAAAPDGALRRDHQQRRPQGRPPHPDARRPRVRRRPRGLASTSRTSCAQCSGPGPARSCRRRPSTRCRSSGRCSRGQLDGALSALLTRREVVAVRRRVDRLLTRRRYPEPSGDWPAIPGPRSETWIGFRVVLGRGPRPVDMSLPAAGPVARQLTCRGRGDIFADAHYRPLSGNPDLTTPDGCALDPRAGRCCCASRESATTSSTVDSTSTGAISTRSASTCGAGRGALTLAPMPRLAAGPDAPAGESGRLTRLRALDDLARRDFRYLHVGCGLGRAAGRPRCGRPTVRAGVPVRPALVPPAPARRASVW